MVLTIVNPFFSSMLGGSLLLTWRREAGFDRG
jgi:hypothetical protein